MRQQEALRKIAHLEGEVARLAVLLARLRDTISYGSTSSPIDSSPINVRRKLWFDFCETYKVNLPPIPLFTSKQNKVTTILFGNKPRNVLARSNEMETLFREEFGKVVTDFKKQTGKYEGLIYIMYKLVDDQPIPLYIGKTEKFGKKGDNLSANLDQAKFARWGYNYAYHMGDLSAIVLQHENTKQTGKYQRWAEALFENPFSTLTLKQPIYVWAQAWSMSPLAMLPQLGPVKLTFLEYILIGIASAEFPDELLNEEGTNRE